MIFYDFRYNFMSAEEMASHCLHFADQAMS